MYNISKEEALHILKHLSYDLSNQICGTAYSTNNPTWCLKKYKAINMAIQALEEHPQGQWIKNKTADSNSTICECSFCHYKDYIKDQDDYWFKRRYCPICGSKMTNFV